MWDVKKGKKHAELGWESPAGVKYCFKVKKSSELIWKSPVTQSTLTLSSTICSEGQVWLCGGGPEEVQGVHHQQSSRVEQGGTRIDETYLFEIFRFPGASNAAQMEHPILHSGG